MPFVPIEYQTMKVHMNRVLVIRTNPKHSFTNFTKEREVYFSLSTFFSAQPTLGQEATEEKYRS